MEAIVSKAVLHRRVTLETMTAGDLEAAGHIEAAQECLRRADSFRLELAMGLHTEDAMATTHRQPDGQEIDLDDYSPLNDAEKLDLIQEVLNRAEDDDATRWESTPGDIKDRVQKVLNMRTWADIDRH